MRLGAASHPTTQAKCRTFQLCFRGRFGVAFLWESWFPSRRDFAFWLGCLGWCFGRFVFFLAVSDFFVAKTSKSLRYDRHTAVHWGRSRGPKGREWCTKFIDLSWNICRGGSSNSVSMNAKVQSPLSMTACSTTTMSNAKISFVCLKSPLAAESTACPRTLVFPRFSAK